MKGPLFSQPLVIRQFAESGFSRTVTCAPGSVTLFTGSDEAQIEAIESALLNLEAGSIDARLGGRKVVASEVYVPGRDASLWKARTVGEFLRSLDLKETDSRVTSLGLAANTNKALIEATPQERSILKVLSAFQIRSAIVVLSNPFFELNTESIKLVATMLPGIAEETGQVYLVFGVKRIPGVWLEDLRVQQEIFGRRPRKISSLGFRGSESKQAVDEVRQLLRVSRAEVDSESDVIVTRPHRLHAQGSKQNFEDYPQSEMISNPSILDVSSDGPKPPAENKRTTTKLTQVGWTERNLLLSSFKNWRKVRAEEQKKRRRATSSLPRAHQIEAIRRRRRYWQGAAVGVVVLFVAIALMQ